MTYRTLPDQGYLLKRLSYEEDTGKLFWLHKAEDEFATLRAARTWNARFAGKEALTSSDENGYLYGRVDYIKWPAHRVIWKMVNGAEPIEVDHINGIRSDNRIVNLRSVSASENRKNMKLSRYNRSGVSGVAETAYGWTAKININGNPIWLGAHPTKAEAVAARVAAERVAGFHPNHGRAR